MHSLCFRMYTDTQIQSEEDNDEIPCYCVGEGDQTSQVDLSLIELEYILSTDSTPQPPMRAIYP